MNFNLKDGQGVNVTGDLIERWYY